MIKKSNIFLVVLIVLIFLIVGPILINEIMFEQNFKKVHGTEDIWISSLSTYFGAIIGGVISGLLTLVGVKLTIESNEKERQLNTIPRKIMIAEDIISKIKGENLYVFPDFRWSVLHGISKLSEDSLQESSEVNYKFYNALRKILDLSNELNDVRNDLKWKEYRVTIETEIIHMESEINKLKETINN